MCVYYRHKTTCYASRQGYLLNKYKYQAKRVSSPRYSSNRATPKGARLPNAYKNSGHKKEEEAAASLLSHIVRTAVGACEPFRNTETPLIARIICIVLGIGVVQTVFSFMSIVAQLTGPFMSLVYTVSGIVASIIAIHEFERSRKNYNRSQLSLKSVKEQPAVDRTTMRIEPVTDPLGQMDLSRITYQKQHKGKDRPLRSNRTKKSTLRP